ncbi:MAG: DNA-directed RNA polymerase subunit beta', partial [Planctomycetota bacterium]
EQNYADTIKVAKKMLERKDEEVWSILAEVIKNHPVLLNRAPTLHRMGIQAFEPVLIEGNAITIHPLVCEGFNADFDGDQMAVHLPLSWEAQVESVTLMLSTNNVFSPANGRPIISASQDIVLGSSFLTWEVYQVEKKEQDKGKKEFCVYRVGDEERPVKAFHSREEVLMAFDLGKVDVHTPVRVRFPKGTVIQLDKNGKKKTLTSPELVLTTVGRILFHEVIPSKMPFYNFPLEKNALKNLIADSYGYLGKEGTLSLLDELKKLGFRWATLSGITFSAEDLKVPEKKAEFLEKAEKEVEKMEKLYKKGVLSEEERYNQIVDCWTRTTELIGKEMLSTLQQDKKDGKPYLNPIFLMSMSGARGNLQQIRQLAGIRGLMANPSGRIIETPIKANFREGLKVLEYFSSTHGARKGLADTALKTADAGHLTRKLADIAQSVVVTMDDCGTTKAITKGYVYKGDKVDMSLSEAIYGRTAKDTIVDLLTDEVIVRENELITEEIAQKIEALGYEKIRVRSPLTCEAPHGVCAKCYGMDLSRGMLAEKGLAVGIIAAQSIGEPGTQLTMRTFHIGGVVSWHVVDKSVKAKKTGFVKFENLKTVTNREGEVIVLNRKGVIEILDDKGRELEKEEIPVGAILKVKEGEKVKKGTILATWDPHMIAMISEHEGYISYEDIRPGVTVREHKDAKTGISRWIVSEHKGDFQPQIIIRESLDEDGHPVGKPLAVHQLPEKAHIEVKEGEHVYPGTILAKIPREIGGTQDITGGLPRVTELFEVRKPKDPAILSEIDGIVEVGDRKRGKRRIVIRSEVGTDEEGNPIYVEKEHLIPQGKNLRVASGDYVKAGEPLVDGPLVPQDVLRISGEEAVQQYLLREIQKVYRSQSVKINDKHVEIIISQMMRRVKVTDAGDTDFLPGQVVDKFVFRKENEKVLKEGKRPATAKPQLLGITKSALFSESFISAASFQETTKVLTEAALESKVDPLRGLKENVILGHMIPAGTGFKEYLKKHIYKEYPVEEIHDYKPDLPHKERLKTLFPDKKTDQSASSESALPLEKKN